MNSLTTVSNNSEMEGCLSSALTAIEEVVNASYSICSVNCWSFCVAELLISTVSYLRSLGLSLIIIFACISCEMLSTAIRQRAIAFFLFYMCERTESQLLLRCKESFVSKAYMPSSMNGYNFATSKKSTSDVIP